MSRSCYPLRVVSHRTCTTPCPSASLRAGGPSRLYSEKSPAPTEAPSDAVVEAAKDLESIPPFKWPNHMPHQAPRIAHPTVIIGKPTRSPVDGQIPAPGRFTPENAWLSTIPLKVRFRTAVKLDQLPPDEELPTLEPRMLKNWWAARMAGRLPTNPVGVEEIKQSQADFRAKHYQRRARIRGIKKMHDPETGEQVDAVVGERIYLPNVVYRLIPNYTNFVRDENGNAIGLEAYNPYMATFRVPKSTTKPDIKSYLKAIYNLDTTFVRTDIYQGPIARAKHGDRVGEKITSAQARGFEKNYKRAVVGLTKPFHYPEDKYEQDILTREQAHAKAVAEKDKRILDAKFQRTMQSRRLDSSGDFMYEKGELVLKHVRRREMHARQATEELTRLEVLRIREEEAKQEAAGKADDA